MESLSVHAQAAPTLRPAHALSGDLAAILREGRVLAGEVLERLDGGTVIVGIGRHRIPASAPSDLAAGARFVFVVERQGAELALRVLPTFAGAEPELVRHLRTRLGNSPPLAEALRSLAAALRGRSDAAPLRAAWQRATFDLTGGAAGLRRSLSAGGMTHEALLARAGSAALAAQTAVVAGELLQRAVGDLAATPGAQGYLERVRSDLARALLALGPEPSASAANDGLTRFAAHLAPADHGDEASARLREALVRWLGGFAAPAGDGAGATWLARRLQRSRVAGQAPPAEIAAAGDDLKSALLLAHAEDAPAGAAPADGEEPVREAARTALLALESEQLLNVARREGGDMQLFVVPLPQGQAALWLGPHDDARSTEDDGGERAFRATIALELSRLGAVRVDLLLRAGRLSIRASVADEASAQRLREHSSALREHLAAAGADFVFDVRTASPDVLRATDLERRVGSLASRHLLDVRA